MSMTVIQIQEALAAKFDPDDLEYRIGRSGIKNSKPWATCLVYATNRAIQQRLDDVVGIGNWRNEFQPWSGKGVLCGISIKIDDEWVCKYDGADETNIEATKGGLSNSMKRAAVQWGIARYLYKFDEEFATCFTDNKGKHNARFEDKQSGTKLWGSWNPPAFPAWAMPDGLKERFYDLLMSESAWEFFTFTMNLPEELLIKLNGTFPTGEKTFLKDKVRVLTSEGAKLFMSMTNALKLAIENDDGLGICEIVDELSHDEKKLLMTRITEEEVGAITEAVKASEKEVEELQEKIDER